MKMDKLTDQHKSDIDTSTSNADYLIEGANVTKYFKDFWGRTKVKAITGVDIKVKRGTVFGLLGPNGAGKSTLMKIILGHLYPTSGKLTVFGKDPRDVETKKSLGYLPERSFLYKHLTPLQTLKFFGEVLELDKSVIKTRSEQLLEMVGLHKAMHRKVGSFSHGMGRRMGMAQALLNDPDLILLDEPTAGLDPLGCREVKDLILTLAKRGKTVVLTSHLLADVEEVSDELMIMYGGTVQNYGKASEILARKDVMQISIPNPGHKDVSQIKAELKNNIDKMDLEISSPNISLESYFIDVVNKASQSVDTFGAQLGQGVASYLKEGIELAQKTEAKPESESNTESEQVIKAEAKIPPTIEKEVETVYQEQSKTPDNQEVSIPQQETIEEKVIETETSKADVQKEESSSNPETIKEVVIEEKEKEKEAIESSTKAVEIEAKPTPSTTVPIQEDKKDTFDDFYSGAVKSTEAINLKAEEEREDKIDYDYINELLK